MYTSAQQVVTPGFDLEQVRADFPALHQQVYGRPLVYLDNAASAQKPRAVIERLATFYSREYANIHRGVHYLSQEATSAYEATRETVAAFINAASTREIVFTRGTTESINLVAATYGRRNVGQGDEIIISAMEHHSNIVPWQLLCEEKGARLRVVPISDEGEIDLEAYERLFTDRTKVVALVHVSNTLGTINPIDQMIELAHEHGVPVLVDGAQAVSHLPVDVQALGCDFYCFSGHKLFGPTGIGVLYGREELLDAMPPYQGGGDMIETVTFEKTTFNRLPHKFEAGTPNIAAGIGLKTAIDYVTGLGLDNIATYEHDLLRYATDRLLEIDGLRIVGTAKEKTGAISFLLDGTHPYDVGTILDQYGVAVRTGHHCTQPLMDRYGIPGTIRASFAFYNTPEDVEALVSAVRKAGAMLA